MNFVGKIKQINLLLKRLERMSADSIWAHRAGGIRGSLLQYLEGIEGKYSKKTTNALDEILDQGYLVLEQAVKLSLKTRRIKVKNVDIPDEIGESLSGKNISPE